MKNLFKLNLFFVGMPITICLLGFFNEAFLFWGLLSTILTGLFQLIIGFAMLIDEPKNKYLQIYILVVIAFFLIWYLNSLIGYNNLITYFLFAVPPILAFYLTFIIYKKR